MTTAVKTNEYQAKIDKFMAKVKNRIVNQPEFLQAVHEVAESVFPIIQNLDVKKYNIESSGSTDYTKFITCYNDLEQELPRACPGDDFIHFSVTTKVMIFLSLDIPKISIIV